MAFNSRLSPDTCSYGTPQILATLKGFLLHRTDHLQGHQIFLCVINAGGRIGSPRLHQLIIVAPLYCLFVVREGGHAMSYAANPRVTGCTLVLTSLPLTFRQPRGGDVSHHALKAEPWASKNARWCGVRRS
jgi:hypothetical protein